LLEVDGTRIKAVTSKDRNFTRAALAEFIKLADEKLDDYRQRLDQSDAINYANRATCRDCPLRSPLHGKPVLFGVPAGGRRCATRWSSVPSVSRIAARTANQRVFTRSA
jgi:hypothetical protein